MEENDIIAAIEERIKSEYNKHRDLDWAKIAAKKIYYSYVNKKIKEDKKL
jgi:hypothetical protein